MQGTVSVPAKPVHAEARQHERTHRVVGPFLFRRLHVELYASLFDVRGSCLHARTPEGTQGRLVPHMMSQ